MLFFLGINKGNPIKWKKTGFFPLMLIISFLILIISDCKKEKEIEPVLFPCSIARSVWVGMQIEGNSTANGTAVHSTSPTLSWQHNGLGLYTGRFGCIYDIYYGTSPYSMIQSATNQTQDSIVLSGLNLNTTYYWKVIAKYNWNSFSENNVSCSLTAE
jgi:hypothetical protein